MYFQLLKLIIWPKDEKLAPREVKFKPGLLNVITGASRTGKSAIIPIIDYCLASSDCFIPIDTIRDYAKWYGVVFTTETEEVLIARGVPVGNKVSNDFYLQRSKTISIPPTISSPNEKLEGIKNILNTISSVPYFSLEGNLERQGYQARLGFRDLMALVFQSQDIVANQNILFYKTHAHEHRERLRNWFPFILGAENIETLKARQRLQEVDQKLQQLKREYDKIKSHSSQWVSNMQGHLKIAAEYGILDRELLHEATSEELVNAAKEVINNLPDYSNSKSADLKSSSNELAIAEDEEERLSNEIGLIKKRLTDLKRLKSGFTDYGNTMKKRVDRLQISQWLLNISNQKTECPLCSSTEHPFSTTEIEKISKAFNKYELESKKVQEIPTSFSREEERLSSELDKLLSKYKEHQSRYDLLISKDKKAQEEFHKRKNLYLFLGHLKASLETFESINDEGDFKKEIDELQSEYDTLIKLVDRSGVKKRIETSLNIIQQNILSHLQTLDVDSKYREIPPKLVIEDLNISILSSDSNWHYLAEIGSASNWVSFHLGLLCGLQEFFTNQKFSHVPSFVIFDQPSQVYFPKVRHNVNDPEEDIKYDDEDVIAVQQIFRTVSNSIINRNGSWQGIILDCTVTVFA